MGILVGYRGWLAHVLSMLGMDQKWKAVEDRLQLKYDFSLKSPFVGKNAEVSIAIIDWIDKNTLPSSTHMHGDLQLKNEALKRHFQSLKTMNRRKDKKLRQRQEMREGIPVNVENSTNDDLRGQVY